MSTGRKPRKKAGAARDVLKEGMISVSSADELSRSSTPVPKSKSKSASSTPKPKSKASALKDRVLQDSGISDSGADELDRQLDDHEDSLEYKDHPGYVLVGPRRPTTGAVNTIGRACLAMTVLTLVLGIVFTLVPTSLHNWFEDPSRLRGAGQFLPADTSKQERIAQAFKYAWHAYERDAFGSDEYHPISQTGSNLTEAGGIGYTIVDALDTMIIMGLDEEYQRAKDWIENKLDFDINGRVSTFETTIRVLGGLLSAHYLTTQKQDPSKRLEQSIFLDKAKDLGHRLLNAFDTRLGLPHSYVNLHTGEGVSTQMVGPGDSASGLPVEILSTAEASTVTLEFKYLYAVTNNIAYWKAAERVMETIYKHLDGRKLVSAFIELESAEFVPSPIRMGSRIDSYYEYLLKQYLLTERRENVYRNMYDLSIEGMMDSLVLKTPTNGLLFTGELNPEREAGGEYSWRLYAKQEHLACFLPGVMMLGATNAGHGYGGDGSISIPPQEDELTPRNWRDFTAGRALLRGCWATHETATGLAPEIAHFRQEDDPPEFASRYPNDWYISGSEPGEPVTFDARYQLRPETVESLFIAYRLTGDSRYRHWGWKIFEAIERHCRVKTGGYASVVNVDKVPVELEDKMESYLLSETFKYLYLLFSDNTVLPLKDVVFNTEGHPFPVFAPRVRPTFG